ncbi:hypothetical protein LUW76_24240 [Actinomadura madurae]|uniref:hypothetical protein n=1 Tax=Actinomadura madurae TaxID=1993 RepID=UPI0020269795|nr:hypothetical protein [Actinomadura madurae]URM97211.1 hypothetical protein LUW76_24240 [Actinomadura madurae]
MVLDELLKGVGEIFLAAAAFALKLFASWFINGAYDLNMNTPNGAGGVLQTLRQHANWITAMAQGCGFLVAAFRLAIKRSGEPFRALMSQFFELAILVLCLATVVHVANVLADGYCRWILSGDDSWTDNIMKDFETVGGGTDVPGTMGMMVVSAVFAVFATVSAVIQWMLMLFRSAAMVILVALLPTFAAARFTSYGDYAYKRALAILVSIYLWAPLGATGLAAGKQFLKSDYTTDHLVGLAWIVAMVVVYPTVNSAIMPAITQDTSSFGIRQAGHFWFGGSAMNYADGKSLLRNRLRRGSGGSGTGQGNSITYVGRPGGGSPAGGGTPTRGGTGSGGGGLTGGGGTGTGGGGTGSGTGTGGGGGTGSGGGVPTGSGGTGSGTGGGGGSPASGGGSPASGGTTDWWTTGGGGTASSSSGPSGAPGSPSTGAPGGPSTGAPGSTVNNSSSGVPADGPSGSSGSGSPGSRPGSGEGGTSGPRPFSIPPGGPSGAGPASSADLPYSPPAPPPELYDPPDFSSIGGTKDGGMPPPPDLGEGPSGSR